MIIKGQTRRISSVFPVLFGLAALILLLFWLGKSGGQGRTNNASDAMIFCGAESVSGDEFVSGEFRFSNGLTQSREQARNGLHSCRLDSVEKFGMTFQLPDPVPGERLEITVWRKKEGTAYGSVVATIRGMEGEYAEAGEPIVQENGWELLKLLYEIPENYRAGEVIIYVYANTLDGGIAYYDDLSIERIPRADVYAENVEND
ncbi:MAG: hypothetical protein AAF206_31525, partial [Bacteroidota bacterium]